MLFDRIIPSCSCHTKASKSLCNRSIPHRWSACFWCLHLQVSMCNKISMLIACRQTVESREITASQRGWLTIWLLVFRSGSFVSGGDITFFFFFFYPQLACQSKFYRETSLPEEYECCSFSFICCLLLPLHIKWIIKTKFFPILKNGNIYMALRRYFSL